MYKREVKNHGSILLSDDSQRKEQKILQRRILFARLRQRLETHRAQLLRKSFRRNCHGTIAQ